MKGFETGACGGSVSRNWSAMDLKIPENLRKKLAQVRNVSGCDGGFDGADSMPVQLVSQRSRRHPQGNYEVS
ncbi:MULTISPECIES: hypothetical protein [unclassified Novosphingobium]|uniref:hypothetical protein n=1 Tax=unclassified Novosphingobium TaxID=2644732 RepID=UPI00135B72DF|nr:MULTISPECIES: hypothetical protein [unclassified Novosphingobium]